MKINLFAYCKHETQKGTLGTKDQTAESIQRNDAARIGACNREDKISCFILRTNRQYSLLEICSVLKITPEDLETSTQVDEGKGPDYAPSPKNPELLEQLKEENKFLKETINNQWQLLKELSKGK